MTDTIENTNKKIVEKMAAVREAIAAAGGAPPAVRADGFALKSLNDRLNEVEQNYNLSIVTILSQYYTTTIGETKKTEQYYRVITGENFVAQIDCIADDLLVAARASHRYIIDKINAAKSIKILSPIKHKNYETCKCGTRMCVVPELSELHCPDEKCGIIKTIVGTVFRDDQLYYHDGQKNKHNGDTARHYKFWMERLQALESTVIENEVLDKINYVLTRDNYNRRTLTCEDMREILKDPKVKATNLNGHTPLLVMTFGGRGPPRLNHRENRLVSSRFNKAMVLYDKINPAGDNKPYYPYFIYKIIEHAFKDIPDKLRLLDYIHLQSRETVIKNDKTFKKMCELAAEDDGLVYRATDPAGRI